MDCRQPQQIVWVPSTHAACLLNCLFSLSSYLTEKTAHFYKKTDWSASGRASYSVKHSGIKNNYLEKLYILAGIHEVSVTIVSDWPNIKKLSNFIKVTNI
jgi:hypothetical protein